MYRKFLKTPCLQCAQYKDEQHKDQNIKVTKTVKGEKLHIKEVNIVLLKTALNLACGDITKQNNAILLFFVEVI